VISGDLAAVCARIDAIDPPAFAPSDLAVSPSNIRERSQDAAAFGALVASESSRLVRKSAAEAGVDPRLVAAVTESESNFDPRATSATGAAGLMQLMPETARELGVIDRYDPEQNMRGGSRYLRALLDRFHGDVPLAVAAYNAGPGAVEKYGGVPPFSETQSYVRRVMETYRRTDR
jgi:soluble lytic murein transglycosylase-like protein